MGRSSTPPAPDAKGEVVATGQLIFVGLGRDNFIAGLLVKLWLVIMVWLVGIAVGLIVFGWWAGQRSTTLRQQTGLPEGRLVYADKHGQPWQPTPQPFYSAEYGLVGKPDYLVKTGQGIVPLEVKSGSAPETPYLGHLLQLAAYCLLVETTTQQKPPYGLLKYDNALYEVDFTEELRMELLAVLEEMREAKQRANVSRSHQQAAKCLACGFNRICSEAL